MQNAGTFGKQVSISQEQQDYNHCGFQTMKHLVQGVHRESGKQRELTAGEFNQSFGECERMSERVWE